MKACFAMILCLLPLGVYALETPTTKPAEKTQNKPTEKTQDITIEIKLNCPMSPELESFVKSMPKAGNYSASYEEWQSSFSKNMHELLKLIESKKVYSSYWTVKTTDALPPETSKTH